MKVIVPIKMVPNPTFPVRMCREAGTLPQPDLSGIPLVINPFDEIALEAAVQLRESQMAQQVIALSIGPESWQGEMRTALALGADRAIHLVTDARLSPLTLARCIRQITLQEAAQLLLFGRQGVDRDQGIVGPMTAAVLGWGQATFVSQIQLEKGVIHVVREVDGGLESLTLPLPALLTTDLRLNTPRYASLPNIMKARRKPLESLLLETFCQTHSIPLLLDQEVLSYQEPPCRPPVTHLQSVAELARVIQEKGVLP
ncbi:MAG: electron transfer flavoprotein subunit beta/FixA family protein [Magnetococcales bacterium]|nr:electron transfer flavoprotein subunit beta/FixA family protein [Magnetococcales bacterium]